ASSGIMQPIFTVGSPRSGSSYLYHLLHYAGGFAEFRTQMNYYDVLEPIYGDLASKKNKGRMLKDWLQSKAFAASGLDAQALKEKTMAECHGGSDFLRIVMEGIARRQRVNRWVDSTRTNAQHMLGIRHGFTKSQIIYN